MNISVCRKVAWTELTVWVTTMSCLQNMMRGIYYIEFNNAIYFLIIYRYIYIEELEIYSLIWVYLQFFYVIGNYSIIYILSVVLKSMIKKTYKKVQECIFIFVID